jgi:hypothetical protein
VLGPWLVLVGLVGIWQGYVGGWDCGFQPVVSWEPKLGVMKAALVLTSARENMEVMQGVDP